MANLNKPLPWECAFNHEPDWIEPLETALSAVMSREDKDRVGRLLDRYNELTDFEDANSNDASALYGVEAEKEEIITEIVGIYSKWRKEAEELKAMLGDDEDEEDE
jgi:hypothetical protein